ncbi:Na+/H+ antiporter [Chloroflexota bacterium]
MHVEDLTLTIEVEIIALILVALVVYIIAKRVRMPYTIALVLTGITISLVGPHLLSEIFPIGLSTELILLVFLPGLIFEAAYHLSLNHLLANIWLILGLAVPGMLVSTAIIGGALHLLLDLPLEVALLYGALISATDPISVLALFKELHVPKRLGILMEGESLFNDGTAVVLFGILLSIALGQTITVAEGITTFAIVIIGGAITGFAIGVLVNYLFQYLEDDTAIQIALTIIVAYGTFLLAEELLHVSPVIAVVVAGVTLGSNQRSGDASLGTQISIGDFWGLVAFLINSTIFLMIGLESPLQFLETSLTPIMIAIVPVVLARALVIYCTAWLSRRVGGNPVPRKWDTVLFWGGLRGSVSLALALSLPLDFEWRYTILALTLGYVTFSLVVGGLSMKPLLRRLGLSRRSESRERWESLLAQLRLGQSTQETVERLSQQHLLPPSLDDNIRYAVDRSLERYWTEMERLLIDDPELLRERTQYILNEIARDRRASLLELENRGFITEHTYHAEIEKLLRQMEESLMAESSEQAFAVLTSLIGTWDQARDLRQVIRDTPEMTTYVVKAALARSASLTLDEITVANRQITPFVADELRPFMAGLRESTETELSQAINENSHVQLEASRMVLREMLDSQRSALSQMLRLGLIANKDHTQLCHRLDTIAAYADDMTEAHELNALLLAVPGMIRNLDVSLGASLDEIVSAGDSSPA